MFDLEIINFLKSVDWVNCSKALFIFIFGYFFAKIISQGLIRFISNKASRSHQLLFKNIIFFIILFIFTSSALSQIGFDLTVLLSAAGILTIAIGVAAQSSLGNFLTGMFLLIEHSIKIGDNIEVNGIKGDVFNISLSTLKMRTDDGIYLQVPNEILAKSQILNYSYFPSRRIVLNVKVPYAQNLNKIEEILLGIANNNKVLKQPLPFVQANRFLDNGFEILFFCWAKNDDFGVVTHELIKSIQEKFSENNIDFVFYPLKF